MKTVNPVGRKFDLEQEADYSTLGCKCSTSSSIYASGEASSSKCGCPSSSTVNTRVTAA